MANREKFFILILTSIFSLSLFASGTHSKVFECLSTVNGPTWNLTYYSTSAPGGPVSEWYELKYTGAEEFTISLKQTASAHDGDSFLAKYSNIDPDGYGKLSVVKIADKIFVDAQLVSTIDGNKLNTDGLIELGEGYICNTDPN